MPLSLKHSALLTLRTLIPQVNLDIVDPKTLSRLRQLWSDAGLGPFPEELDVQTLLAKLRKPLTPCESKNSMCLRPRRTEASLADDSESGASAPDFTFWTVTLAIPGSSLRRPWPPFQPSARLGHVPGTRLDSRAQ